MGLRAVPTVLSSVLLCACGVAPAPTPVTTPVTTPMTHAAPIPTPTPAPPTASEALPGVDCTSSVRTGPLPVWARAGFSDDGSSFRHVEGLHGAVVGVVFGYPLSSPPRPDRANKILWVARDALAGERIKISARLEGHGPAVEREVGFGGGQSIVDLPRPGCWRLTLTWGDAVADVVDVPYAASG